MFHLADCADGLIGELVLAGASFYLAFDSSIGVCTKKLLFFIIYLHF
jgi:hypothetical protein